jgi:hypothetical protein
MTASSDGRNGKHRAARKQSIPRRCARAFVRHTNLVRITDAMADPIAGTGARCTFVAAMMMRRAVMFVLAVAGCASPGSAALKQEKLAEIRGQLGDPMGAERAARQASGLREEARLRVEQGHGWLWHDLAMH